MTENLLLFIFAVATPAVVALIRYALRKARVAVLRNLSALLVTGIVCTVFAVIATAVEHDFESNVRRLTNVAIDFCIIFSIAHWVFKIVKTINDKRKG